MKRMQGLMLILAAGFLGACATSDESVKRALLKNPDILFQVIEENPEAFLNSVNKAAQVAQKKQIENRRRDDEAQLQADLKNPKKPDMEGGVRRISGKADAPIVVVEYADFQCPACAAGHRSMKNFLKKHGDKVQLHVKHMPLDFHPMAMPLAQAFEAVRKVAPDKLMAFHNAMFETQAQMRDPSYLKNTLKKLGIDVAKVEKESQSDTVAKTIAKDQQEFEKFGFNSTPTIIFNGVALVGAQPMEVLEEIAEKTKAK